jgi:hypothetical protein
MMCLVTRIMLPLTALAHAARACIPIATEPPAPRPETSSTEVRSQASDTVAPAIGAAASQPVTSTVPSKSVTSQAR